MVSSSHTTLEYRIDLMKGSHLRKSIFSSNSHYLIFSTHTLYRSRVTTIMSVVSNTSINIVDGAYFKIPICPKYYLSRTSTVLSLVWNTVSTELALTSPDTMQ